MTIRVKAGKIRLRLWVSLRFACFIGASCAKREVKKRGGESKVVFGKEQRRALFKSLKQAKKDFGKLEILSVQAADGTIVSIRL